MRLLKISFLRCFVKAAHLKSMYFSVVYKLLTIFNYSLFFYFKLLSIKHIFLRLYLLNTSFYFLFIDYIYLINYISFFYRGKFCLFSLPIKTRSLCILRSPFIYSKSREHFIIQQHCLYLSLSLFKSAPIYFLFFNQLLLNFKFDNSKF